MRRKGISNAFSSVIFFCKTKRVDAHDQRVGFFSFIYTDKTICLFEHGL